MRHPKAFLSRVPRLFAGLLLPIALALGAAPCALADPAEDARANALKVAYFYNFTRFIQWPEAALGKTFVIAVIGDPALAAALEVLEGADKRVQGRPIEVRVLDRADRLGDSQMLFIGAAALSDLRRIVAQTRDRPVLSVGDGRGLAQHGVAIGLFLKPDILGTGSRLRFEINRLVIEGSGLKVSAQLYDVAEVIE